MAPVITEGAIVYRVGRRRFLSKRAAIHRMALNRVKDKYPCECESETGYTCNVHHGEPPFFNRLVHRYERRLRVWLRSPR